MPGLGESIVKVLTFGGRISSAFPLIGFVIAAGTVSLLTSSAIAGIIVLFLGLATFLSALALVPAEQRSSLFHPPTEYRPVSEMRPDTPTASTQGALADPSTSALDKVIFLHTLEHVDGRRFGADGQFEAQFFVDFMQAALVSQHREVLAAQLQEAITQSVNLERYSVIACPKRGNPLVIAQAAEDLGLQPIFVKEKSLFGRNLDGAGLVVSGDRAILADDISSDGELLTRAAVRLREAGMIVDHAFVLIDRSEGDAVDRLAEIDVVLHAVRTLGDDEIRGLVNRLRARLP